MLDKRILSNAGRKGQDRLFHIKQHSTGFIGSADNIFFSTECQQVVEASIDELCSIYFQSIVFLSIAFDTLAWIRRKKPDLENSLTPTCINPLHCIGPGTHLTIKAAQSKSFTGKIWGTHAVKSITCLLISSATTGCVRRRMKLTNQMFSAIKGHQTRIQGKHLEQDEIWWQKKRFQLCRTAFPALLWMPEWWTCTFFLMFFWSSNNVRFSRAFVLFPANWTLSSQSVFQSYKAECVALIHLILPLFHHALTMKTCPSSKTCPVAWSTKRHND